MVLSFSLLFSLNLGKLEGRELHCVVAVQDSLYLWGGKIAGEDSCTQDQLKNLFYSVLHFPLSTGEWTTRGTTGNPPHGLLGYSCSVVADKLYFFGGCLPLNHVHEFYNSITRLDAPNLKWKELKPNNPDIPVMRRAQGRMVSFDSNGDHHLLMIGGVGFAPTVPIPNLGYLCGDDGRIDAKTLFHTNEHSLYNISSGMALAKYPNPCILLLASVGTPSLCQNMEDGSGYMQPFMNHYKQLFLL